MVKLNSLTWLGIIVIVFSILFWFWVSRWVNDPTFNPLSVPFPTSVGSHLEKKFFVNNADRYFLIIFCKPRGFLEGKDNIDFGNEYKSQKIPCTISVIIKNKDSVTLNSKVEFLSPGFLGPDNLGYELLYVDLPKSGEYELEILNETDLSYLDASEPRLEIKIRSSTIVGRLFIFELSKYACPALGLFGLALLIIGIITRKK